MKLSLFFATLLMTGVVAAREPKCARNYLKEGDLTSIKSDIVVDRYRDWSNSYFARDVAFDENGAIDGQERIWGLQCGIKDIFLHPVGESESRLPTYPFVIKAGSVYKVIRKIDIRQSDRPSLTHRFGRNEVNYILDAQSEFDGSEYRLQVECKNTVPCAETKVLKHILEKVK